MSEIRLGPGQSLRLAFEMMQVEPGPGAHRLSLNYRAEPVNLPVGAVLVLGGTAVLHAGGWLGTLHPEAAMPISVNAVYPRPTVLTTTISDGQLAGLEAARDGRDLELLITLNATLTGAPELDYPSSSTQDWLRIPGPEWARHAERLGALVTVPLRVPLPLGDPHSTRARAGLHLQASMRAISDGRHHEAVREARIALELHGEVSPPASYSKAEAARTRDLPQRFAVLRDSVYAVASGAAHGDEVTESFEYSRSDAMTVVAAVAALMQRSP
ncbi:hypothetical protein [Quadrisphaera setariae]|uniref:Uncharacterized protein n=1 Tax=Quadrisphaera setariae TaxID=2593304 RepID=A0A5C8ZF24_9ACTN|nr:hypothetical protein [Quadrisphaera setariae]TXR55761.1 hypothetical protein FMM08_13135 [Quadrisphaera setariae]